MRTVVVVLLVLASQTYAAPIPDSVFPGIALAAPLEDRHVTGQAMPFAGQVVDADKANGQLLLQFIPQAGGQAIRIPIQLQGDTFFSHVLFLHDQAGTYDLEVFVGGPDELQLTGIGRFSGVVVSQGSGVIRLPTTFFRGMELDTPFPTQYRTGETIRLRGTVGLALANAQLILNLVGADGEQYQSTQTLNGERFDLQHLFLHDQTGLYQMQVFIGFERLELSGEFAIEIQQGTGDILIPPDYFFGLELARPLPGVWEIGQPVDVAGQVDAGIQAMRLEIGPAGGGEVRIIPVGLAAGLFRAPVRLQPGEEGRLALQIIVQRLDGSLAFTGRFPLEGIPARPAPRLVLGALALGIKAQSAEELTLTNQGDADLDDLVFRLEGPFDLIDGPGALARGATAKASVRYTGAGGDQGILQAVDAQGQVLGQVVLSGLATRDGVLDTDILHLQADAAGQIHLAPGQRNQDYLLILYAVQPPAAEDTEREYAFTLGRGAAAARMRPDLVSPLLPAVQARHVFEAALRRQERQLATALRTGATTPSKRMQAAYSLGDRRQLVFPAGGRVGQTLVQASVVALNARAVAWQQDDLRPHNANLAADQIQQVIDQFAQDMDQIVARFGAGSDVDGDGKVSFLFTHLVNDVGAVSGFYNASSVLPQERGGNGNQMDLMFLAPDLPLRAYRSLLVHEFQHLISFNQHVLVRNGPAEASWLNEGLSHLAEDLVADFSASGQSAIIAAFLRDTGAVGLAGDALLDAAKRGAAYLFVRSLVDRFGDAVVLRLMTSGLSDRDNVEAATGEPLAQVLAFWGGQLYLSGLGLVPHARLNYASPLLQAGQQRGFALPVAQQYTVGGADIVGRLQSRGVQFIRIQGGDADGLVVAGAPEAGLGAALVPLDRSFHPPVWVPADYIPGLHFTQRIPGRFVVGRPVRFAGQVQDEAVSRLALQFNGPDTLVFHPQINEGAFAQQMEFSAAQAGLYELIAFTGADASQLGFVARFGPIAVVEEQDATAVVAAGPEPRQAELGLAFPNPFNAGTVIPFRVGTGEQTVKLEIYNILGQRVRRLHDGLLDSGQQRVVWDGRNDQGQALGTGVYFYRLEAGSYRAVRRLLMLR